MSKFRFFDSGGRYRFYNVSLWIVLINVFFYIFINRNYQSYLYFGIQPTLLIEQGYYWQLFTYMFCHGSFSHLLFNMLTIYFLGSPVEQRMGSREFLIFYLLTGILSGLISLTIYLISGSMMVVLIGASGAVFGLLLAFVTFYPNARLLLFFMIPVKAPTLLIGYTAIELFLFIDRPGSTISHATHLAGLLVAYIYCRIRYSIDPVRVIKNSFRRH